MPGSGGPLTVDRSLVIPDNELKWRFSKSSGPGGQAVNTTDTRAELRWDVTDSGVLTPSQRGRIMRSMGDELVDGAVVIVAAEHRSQWQNRQAARGRLAARVKRALAPPPRRRRATRPSRRSVRRRLEAKTRRGSLKRTRRPPGSDE